MGLRKSAGPAVDQTSATATTAAEPAAATKPAFEAAEPATNAANEPAATVGVASPVVSEVTTNAVVPVKPSGLPAIVGSKYKPALDGYRDQIDPASLDFDTFTRITCGLDGFSDDQKKELGKQVKIQIMSWNERFIVTTGEDNDEANALTRFSLDGKTIDGTGQPVPDYIAHLVNEGYEDSCSKKYYSLYGFLVATSPNGQLEDIPPADRAIVNVQIAPRSVSQFTQFQITHGVKVSQGIVADTDLLLLTQEKKDGKTKKYASIKFAAAYPAAA